MSLPTAAASTGEDGNRMEVDAANVVAAIERMIDLTLGPHYWRAVIESCGIKVAIYIIISAVCGSINLRLSCILI